MTRIPLPEPGPWYVVLTAPQREFNAAAEMRRVGYFTWLPFVRVKKKFKRPNSKVPRIETVNRAHYERYVFVALKYEGQGLGDLRNVPHVSGLVRTRLSGVPLRVPDWFMSDLMAKGDGTEFIREIDEVSAKSRRKYAKGDAVTLKGTPFDDFVALVEHDLGGKKLKVEVEVFGGKRRVTVKAEQVEEKVAA